VKKKWLILPVCAGLALMALVVWLGAEDARQAALLDAREREAEIRFARATDRFKCLVGDGAPAEEVRQADLEVYRAWGEQEMLIDKQEQRWQSWPARLLREVRRRTGW
jgi:hypothetical protein